MAVPARRSELGGFCLLVCDDVLGADDIKLASFGHDGPLAAGAWQPAAQHRAASRCDRSHKT